MGVIMIITDEAGQINQPGIRRVKIISTDNLATVTAAGYLNQEVLQGYFIYNTDIIDMWYGAVGGANFITSQGTYAEFTPSISNGVITLVQTVQPGGVTVTGTPTVGHIARFSSTSSIEEGGVLGQAAAKAVSNNAKTNVASVDAATVLNNLLSAADTSGTVKDSGVAASNLLLLNAANTLTGSGSIKLVKGTGTEAANVVTVNNQAGVITTSALTTAGGASYAITWTNSSIVAGSSILLTLMGGTNTVKNITLQATAGSGTSTLTIYNNTAAIALNGTLIIGFLVV